MKNLLNIFFINLIVLFIILFLIEIFTGSYFFGIKNCGYFECNIKEKYKVDLYTKEKKIIEYNKDKYGFRGKRKNLIDVDIVVVGGSTSNQRFLNIADTWIDKFENKLNKIGYEYDVISAGLDGQSSFGHVWNFDNWFNKIENFKPKYIFFYLGINEHENSNNYDNPINLIEGFSILNKTKFYIKNNNGILIKTYLRLKNHFQDDKLNVAHKKRKAIYNTINNQTNINVDLKKFENNLKKLILLTKEKQAIPVFITQKTLRWKKDKNKVYSIDNTNYFLKEKIISEKIIDICRMNNIRCIDVFKNLSLTVADTYDLIHLNPEGSSRLSNFVFNEFIKNY